MEWTDRSVGKRLQESRAWDSTDAHKESCPLPAGGVSAQSKSYAAKEVLHGQDRRPVSTPTVTLGRECPRAVHFREHAVVPPRQAPRGLRKEVERAHRG